MTAEEGVTATCSVGRIDENAYITAPYRNRRYFDRCLCGGRRSVGPWCGRCWPAGFGVHDRQRVGDRPHDPRDRLACRGERNPFFQDLGERQFSAREQQLLRFFHVELGRLIGHSLVSPTEPRPERLSRRLGQTLACLLEGNSEKQVAVVSV